MRFDRSSPTATRSNRSDGRPRDAGRRDRHPGDEGRHEHPLRAGIVHRRRSVEEREALAVLRDFDIHAA